MQYAEVLAILVCEEEVKYTTPDEFFSSPAPTGDRSVHLAFVWWFKEVIESPTSQRQKAFLNLGRKDNVPLNMAIFERAYFTMGGAGMPRREWVQVVPVRLSTSRTMGRALACHAWFLHDGTCLLMPQAECFLYRVPMVPRMAKYRPGGESTRNHWVLNAFACKTVDIDGLRGGKPGMLGDSWVHLRVLEST